MNHEFIQTYTARFEHPDTIMLGDIGAIEKLSLESAFRDAGLDRIDCATMAGVWSNVVHLNCKYTDEIYCKFRDTLLVLPEGSFRNEMRARFLVALGRTDFPNLEYS
jgi:hypothetical protein